MTEEKDLQQYKRRVKDISYSISVDMDEFLSDRPDIWLIYKKTEKLAEAVYLVTDFLNNKESLKWKLRSGAVDLLCHITLSLRKRDVSYREIAGHAVQVASHLVALLTVAKEVRLMSAMNVSILREEYRSLMQAIHKECAHASPQSGFTFPHNFFSYTPPSPRENVREGISDPPPEPPESYKRHNYKGQKENVFNIKDAKMAKKNKEDIEGRRNAILQFLKTKGEVNIKDIAAVVTDCSEKTIQRELMSLIAGGVIERVGERRWSRYRLSSE